MKLYPKLVKKTFTIKEKTDLVDCRPWLGNDSTTRYGIGMESKRSRRDSTSIDYLKKGRAFMELKGKKDSSSKRSTFVEANFPNRERRT